MSCGVWFLKLQRVVVASRSSGLKTGLYMCTEQRLLKLDPVDRDTTGLLNNRNYTPIKKAYHRILKSSPTALAEPNLTSHSY
jgi:hypothetical protein